jgi:hypothetical protein
MAVLKIVGVLILIGVGYLVIRTINISTQQKYGYTFFNVVNFSLISAGYTLGYFGYGWYSKALSQGGDILNGELLMLFGAILVGVAFYYNSQKVPIGLALGLGIVQCILYIPMSYFALLAIAIAIAWFSQTKPVFSINGRGE